MKRSLIFLFICFFISYSFANDVSDTIPSKKLRIGIRESPPFIIIDNGKISGVSIDLWNKIADELHLKYELVEFQYIDQLLKAMKDREIDLSISPLTVTSERLKNFEFSQPFYSSSFSVAIAGQKRSFIWVFISNIFSLDFLKVVLSIIFILFCFGLIIWLMERKKNYRYARNYRGIGDGIWWAMVTLSTVGYGDKYPITNMGRSLGAVWMFTALIMVSSFTASITAALTVERIGIPVEEITDLSRHSAIVSTIKNSSTESFLKNSGINNEKPASTIDEGIEFLLNGSANIFVYDTPILQYMIQKKTVGDRIYLVSKTFNTQYYSFLFHKNSPYPQFINPVLLKALESSDWIKILQQYNLEQK